MVVISREIIITAYQMNVITIMWVILYRDKSTAHDRVGVSLAVFEDTVAGMISLSLGK